MNKRERSEYNRQHLWSGDFPEKSLGCLVDVMVFVVLVIALSSFFSLLV